MGLHNAHFYHGMIRKYVVSFGNLFNNIHVVRFNEDGSELFREKVPMSYGPKEKWLYRTEQNPDLKERYALKMPRISYELKELRYDPMRKTPSTNKLRADTGTVDSKKYQYNAVPYELLFDVYVGGKNSDECLQMVEQIVPFFTPDYTLTISSAPEIDQTLDVPITMNSTLIDDTWDAAFTERRHILWTLNFSLRGFLYAPTRDSKIILQAEWNIEGFDGELYAAGIETEQ